MTLAFRRRIGWAFLIIAIAQLPMPCLACELIVGSKVICPFGFLDPCRECRAQGWAPLWLAVADFNAALFERYVEPPLHRLLWRLF